MYINFNGYTHLQSNVQVKMIREGKIKGTKNCDIKI